jgi:hypothetical protein
MTSIASMEAPVIPIEIEGGKKEEVVVATQAVEVEDGQALTEEMLYPDRAILTSEFVCFRHLASTLMCSLPWSSGHQAGTSEMGSCFSGRTWSSPVIPASRFHQEEECRRVSPTSSMHV